MPSQLAQNVSLLSEIIEYVSAEELTSRFKFCPESLYIRKNVQSISADKINDLKEDLVYRGTEGENPVVRINNPLTVFTLDGIEYLAAGNSRTRCIAEMLNETKFKGMTFAPVPFRRLQVEPTFDNLIRLQIGDNDTTNAHNVFDLARIVDQYWNQANEAALASGKNAQKAGGIATQACVALTGKTVAYIGQLRGYLDLDEWLVKNVIAGRLNNDTALNMKRFSESSGMPLESVYKGCEALAVGEKGIYKSHLTNFIKGVKKSSTTESAETGEGSESGEGTEQRQSKKLVAPAKAIEKVEDIVSTYETLEVANVNPLHHELAEKTANSVSKIVSGALKAQVIDVSDAATVLPTVANSLQALIGFSLINTLDAVAISEMETSEDKTAATQAAVKALKVSGTVIGLLFSEGLIPADKTLDALSALQATFVQFFDTIDLETAYNAEELSALYGQMSGLGKTLGLLSTDELSGDSVSTEDDEDLEDDETAEDDTEQPITAENDEYTATAE